MIPEGTPTLDILAKVLAKYRYTDVRVGMDSMSALIACELSEAMRQADPDWDYQSFWNAIARAQRERQTQP